MTGLIYVNDLAYPTLNNKALTLRTVSPEPFEGTVTSRMRGSMFASAQREIAHLQGELEKAEARRT